MTIKEWHRRLPPLKLVPIRWFWDGWTGKLEGQEAMYVHWNKGLNPDQRKRDSLDYDEMVAEIEQQEEAYQQELAKKPFWWRPVAKTLDLWKADHFQPEVASKPFEWRAVGRRLGSGWEVRIAHGWMDYRFNWKRAETLSERRPYLNL